MYTSKKGDTYNDVAFIIINVHIPYMICISIITYTIQHYKNLIGLPYNIIQ